MPMSMYTASVPVFQHVLRNLSHILDKAEANAHARKFEPSVFMTARLAPDMLPFQRQVLIACDAAKNGMARISGVEAPKFEDNEATIGELRTRIQKTLDYLEKVPASAVDGKEETEFTFPVAGNPRTMKGQPYLTTWVLANFFFHVTTAYNILRHNGVDLGKADYLAGARR